MCHLGSSTLWMTYTFLKAAFQLFKNQITTQRGVIATWQPFHSKYKIITLHYKHRRLSRGRYTAAFILLFQNMSLSGTHRRPQLVNFNHVTNNTWTMLCILYCNLGKYNSRQCIKVIYNTAATTFVWCAAVVHTLIWSILIHPEHLVTTSPDEIFKHPTCPSEASLWIRARLKCAALSGCTWVYWCFELC